MKSDSEYKRTLYEKYDKRMIERKMTRRSTWISSLSAAACLLIVFAFLASPFVNLFHLYDGEAFPTQVTISENDTILRIYTDEKTVSAVCEMLEELSLSPSFEEITEGEVLYVVTKQYSDGTEETLYHAEIGIGVGITDSSSSLSMQDILDRYP